MDFGDVSERVALRNRLKCKSFRWYLQHVYPEMRIYNNTITYGEVRALTHTTKVENKLSLYINPHVYLKSTSSFLLTLYPIYTMLKEIRSTDALYHRRERGCS